MILQTGQRLCFTTTGSSMDCAGSGQDGERRPGLPWPEPRFETLGKTVLDRLTGLTWLADANAPGFPLPWQEANDFCASLVTDGPDWRLPSRRELQSLLSFAAANPALPKGHPFQNVFSGWYWSATPSVLAPGYAWRVQLSGGRMFHGAPTDPCMIWPVRGQSELLGGASGPLLEPDGDEVLDRRNGLRWMRRANLCGPVLWQDALNKTLTLGNGWRLPSIHELASLADLKRSHPALPQDHPFLETGEVYWSSTTSSFETNWAMAFYLDKGAVGVGFKAGPERFLAWTVRNESRD